MEYQYGNLPSDTVNAFSTLYDRLIVDYSYEKFKAGISFEQFTSPYETRNYYRITQARLQYYGDNLEIQLGNIYETLGRGTLLRSYQIPGAVLEDLTFRSRYFFNQDLMGGMAKYKLKKFTFKGIYSYPLNAVLPPNQEVSDRRPDRTAAIDLGYTFENHSVGAAFMNIGNTSSNYSLAMIRGSGNISPSISYYTELAKNLDSQYQLLDFSANSSYAWYANLNYYAENFGISAEFKSYKEFVLGLAINQPPALVKQHVYRQLNRSTHIMNAMNESGYQIEGFYNFPTETDEPGNSILTVNHTLAINDFGRRFIFQEYFVEYASTILDLADYKLFADYAEDPFKGQEARLSGGIYVDWKLTKKSGLSTEYEFQRFSRFGNTFQNQLIALTYNYKSKYSVNILAEYSTDDFLLDSGENSRIWFGTNLKYKPGFRNTFLLFAGTRRGGPACNSGVCYEILDFRGMELRWTTRL